MSLENESIIYLPDGFVLLVVDNDTETEKSSDKVQHFLS